MRDDPGSISCRAQMDEGTPLTTMRPAGPTVREICGHLVSYRGNYLEESFLSEMRMICGRDILQI